MGARPRLEPDPDPEPDALEAILGVLPAQYHEQFLGEYAAAVDDAQRPDRSPQLRSLLRRWRLRATAYADPTYAERRAAAREGRGDWVAIEQLVPDWSDRLRGRSMTGRNVADASC